MKPADMLHAMCQKLLSAADVKAISKSRGFSPQETGSRALFENFFLSNIGVESALNALNENEIALLHLLHFNDDAVSITFFDRIYGNTNKSRNYYQMTYNQQYQPVFGQVNARLVRSGVLIYAELDNIAAGQTKLERRRFRFPAEFAPYLPRPVSSVITAVVQGTVQDGFRAQLAQLTQPVKRTRQSHQSPGITLVDGELRLGDHPFQAARLSQWRQATWERAVWQAHLRGSIAQPQGTIWNSINYETDDGASYDVSPVPFMLYMMAQLGPDEWLPPEALTTLLHVFYGQKSHLPADQLCQLGWEHGCLARTMYRKQVCYRPVSAAQMLPETTDPAAYFRVNDKQQVVVVDLERIPYESLEIVNQVATLKVRHGQIEAVPDIVRISDTAPTAREHAVTRWLVEHSAAFRAALDTVTAQWGRLIVHQNILAARITDLSLRVMLEKTFGDQLITLSNEFIAFPYGLRREIEKAVAKAGYVVKVMRA